MFFNITDKSFFYLLFFPICAVVLGSISFYVVDLIVDEPTIGNMEDAFWLTITTMTTVGFGEVYPATTEGRIVATILLFAGILTFFGFLSTIASKIIKPTLKVKTKNKSDDQRGSNRRPNIVGKYGNDINGNNKYYNEDQLKEFLKERIDSLDRMNKEEFTNLVIDIVDYYQNNYNKNR
ncbi:MAG TPA: potassium channel family protein [Candidatus Saccharimonadales bacterium]|nr:potassium channel family protein [Candidatus Saccharimonadales bacterium]